MAKDEWGQLSFRAARHLDTRRGGGGGHFLFLLPLTSSGISKKNLERKVLEKTSGMSSRFFVV
jgi:hypothetical protein